MCGPSKRCWVQEALALLQRENDLQTVESNLSAIVAAGWSQHRLDAPGMTPMLPCTARPSSAYCEAGLDEPLVGALYAVESDPQHNASAEDVAPTLAALHDAGLGLAVLSDIHFDLRPAFRSAGIQGLVDVFMLWYEQGCRSPILPCSRVPSQRWGRRPTRR